jgi:hypothetical protein
LKELRYHSSAHRTPETRNQKPETRNQKPETCAKRLAFDIFEKQIIRKSPAERRKLQAVLSDLVDRYVAEIGENLNAALNVATEFSKLLEGKEVSLSTIQTLASTWADRVTSKAFDVHSYLAQISDIEERVMGA